MTSPGNPPRSPGGRLINQKIKNMQSPRLPLDQNRKGRTSRRGKKQRDDVRDGKFFHVRVSLGYLTSLRNLRMDDKCAGDSILSVFASFTPKAAERGEYNFATSLPLQPDAERHTVKWPKGTDVVTSKRRLYHSVILRSDDLASEENRGLTFDDDESTAMLSPAPYAPAFVNIYVGLKRGEETVSIGVATLVISGRPVKNQKLDLPVKNLALPKGKPEEMQNMSKRVAGLKKSLFGTRSKKTSENQVDIAEEDLAIASDGTKRYAFEKTAILQIKLDTVESVHQSNGPGLWGDLEDDEESFGPVPVIDIPDDFTVDLTNRYQHESIEVMQFKQGTTIISSPGHGEVEESGENNVEIGGPQSPTEIVTPTPGRFLRKKSRKDKVDGKRSSVTEEDGASADSADMYGDESCSHDSVSDIEDSEYGSYITHDDCTTRDGKSEHERIESTPSSHSLLLYASKVGEAVGDMLDGTPDSFSQNVSSCGSSRKYESSYPNSFSKSADFTNSFGDESSVEESDASCSVTVE